jgi:hypothetical protein
VVKKQVPFNHVDTFILLAIVFAAGVWVGMRFGGRRALWRLHTGNYKKMVRDLDL